MQRRAAAGYVVLFLVLAAGAYALVTVATPPAVSVENPDHALGSGDQFTVDGRTYTVQSVEATEEEGSVTYAATLTWRNDSARYTEEWEVGDDVEFSGVDAFGARLNGSYTVVVANVSDPTEATLRAVPPENVTTREIDGVTYVETRDEDGTLQQTPIDQYDPLQRVSVTEGSLDYLGNRTDVAITNETVTLSWTAPGSVEVELSQAANVTLNEQRFFTYFASDEEVRLTRDASGYRASVAQRDRFNERRNGLWGITLLGGTAAVLLTALAFLPRKDI